MIQKILVQNSAAHDNRDKFDQFLFFVKYTKNV